MAVTSFLESIVQIAFKTLHSAYLPPRTNTAVKAKSLQTRGSGRTMQKARYLLYHQQNCVD